MAGEGDAERLVVMLEARLTDYERNMQKASGVSKKNFDAMRNQSKSATAQMEADMLRTTTAINRALEATGSRVSGFRRTLAGGLGGLGLVLGTAELIKLSDTWTDLNGRIQIAVGGMQEGADVMERLGTMARRTYSSLDATAESFLTNSKALKELGYNTNQQLDFTEALNNALVVSGAKGDRATSVLNALGKAMAGGKLQGDNLNTVIETGGRVAQALADGLGVSTNELRRLGSEGKLTSDTVFKALTGQMGKLRTEADGMAATISDAFTLLRNSMLEYVGGADEAAGASARIANSIILLADNFDAVANAALNVSTVLMGALAGRAVVGATMQVISLGKALRDFVAIARTAQSVGGLSTAMAGLGSAAGPIGLLVGGAAALALGHFANKAFEAEQRSKRVNEVLAEMGIVSREAAAGIDEAAGAQNRLATAKGLAENLQKTEDLSAELQAAKKDFDDLALGVDGFGTSIASAMEGAQDDTELQRKRLGELVTAFGNGKLPLKDFEDGLNSVAVALPDLADWIAQLIDAGARVWDIDEGLRAVAGQAAAAQLPGLPGPAMPRGALGVSRRELNEKQGIGADYVTEQERVLALTKQQRDVEEAIARIKKDVAEKNGLIDPAEAERLAKLQVAAQAQSSARGKSTKAAKDENEAVRELIASLEFEKSLIGLSALEQEKLRTVRQAGSSATDKQREAIERLVTETYGQQLQVQQLQDTYDMLGQTGMSAVQGIISALDDGKISAEEFGSILSNVLSMAANFFMNQAFSSMGFGGGGGSGGFNIMKMLGFATGTANTGGQRGQPRGIVHGQEAVIPLPDGGKVPVQIQQPPMAMSANTDGGTKTFAPVININGSGLNESQLQQAIGAALDDYSRFKFHDDWESHNSDPMARG